MLISRPDLSTSPRRRRIPRGAPFVVEPVVHRSVGSSTRPPLGAARQHGSANSTWTSESHQCCPAVRNRAVPSASAQLQPAWYVRGSTWIPCHTTFSVSIATARTVPYRAHQDIHSVERISPCHSDRREISRAVHRSLDRAIPAAQNVVTRVNRVGATGLEPALDAEATKPTPQGIAPLSSVARQHFGTVSRVCRCEQT